MMKIKYKIKSGVEEITPAHIVAGVATCLFFIPLTYFISLWTDRTLEFWLTLIKGSAVEVPMWASVLVTIILSGVILGINILTELIRLVN